MGLAIVALELRVCMVGVYERDEIPAEMHSEVLECLEVNVESRRNSSLFWQSKCVQ